MTRRPNIVDLVYRLRACAAGAALVEFTIVAPFLFVLGFGVVEFGRFMYQHQLVQTGVRDAARYLARIPNPADVAQQTNAKNLALTGQVTSGGTIRVYNWTAANINFVITPIANAIDPGTGASPYRGADPLLVIEVTTNWTFADTLGVHGFLGLGSGITVNVTHEERHIGE
jgi:Flp pilus assembly protein TadG